MNKTLWTVLLVLVLALAGGVWWLYSSLDAVVASAIRVSGPDMTGVSVKVAAVKIQPADGTSLLRELEVGNRPGFTTARALFAGQVNMKLDAASLTKDLVLVYEITIEAPEITYEYTSGGSNLDAIQYYVETHISEMTGAKGVASKGEPEKKVIIENLYIKGAHVKVHADRLQGKVVTLPLPDLHLTNIGKKSNGVSPSEATRQVVSAIVQNATKTVTRLVKL
jgi:hypothetical protein